MLAEGRTIKIYGPPNWSFRISFIGEYLYIRAEDIVEGDPVSRPALVPNRNMASGVLNREYIPEPHLEIEEEFEEEDEAQEENNEAQHEAHEDEDNEVDDEEWYTDAVEISIKTPKILKTNMKPLRMTTM